MNCDTPQRHSLDQKSHPIVNFHVELTRKKIFTLKPTGDSTLTACFFQAVAGMFLSMSVSIKTQLSPVQRLLLGFVCRCFPSLLQIGQTGVHEQQQRSVNLHHGHQQYQQQQHKQ